MKNKFFFIQCGIFLLGLFWLSCGDAQNIHSQREEIVVPKEKPVEPKTSSSEATLGTDRNVTATVVIALPRSTPTLVPVVATPDKGETSVLPKPTQTPIPFPSPMPVVAVTVNASNEVLTTVEVVKMLKPSVVRVATKKMSAGMLNQEMPQSGVGSGILLDKEGRILTNNHVVEEAQAVLVTLSDGRSYPAQLIGRDVITDLAVIQVDGALLEPARLGDSSSIEVGEDVIAVGHAFGLKGGPTVSKGVVSALNRTIDTGNRVTMVGLIQTDASINPGNSGGPLANMRGEVVGINTVMIDRGNSIGFAINIDDAKVIVEQLLDHGEVKRGFIGIAPIDVTDFIREQIGLPVSDGVIIARVFGGYPAEESQLQSEDVIVRLDSTKINSVGDLSRFLIGRSPGETVEVGFYRDGTLMAVDLTLGEQP